MQIHTRTITSGNNMVVNSGDNILQISVLADGTGTGTVLGNLSLGGVAATATAIGAGQGFTLSSPTPNTPLTGITIACTAGSLSVIAGVM